MQQTGKAKETILIHVARGPCPSWNTLGGGTDRRRTETCIYFTSSENSWIVGVLHCMHFPVPPAKLNGRKWFRLMPEDVR